MTSKEELEAILDTFTSKGWKLILQHIVEYRDSRDDIRGCDGTEDFLRRIGELESLDWFINLETWYSYMEEENAS